MHCFFVSKAKRQTNFESLFNCEKACPQKTNRKTKNADEGRFRLESAPGRTNVPTVSQKIGSVRRKSKKRRKNRNHMCGKRCKVNDQAFFFLINRFFGTFEVISYLQSKEITTIRYITKIRKKEPSQHDWLAN